MSILTRLKNGLINKEIAILLIMVLQVDLYYKRTIMDVAESIGTIIDGNLKPMEKTKLISAILGSRVRKTA
jgi:hypothetical protein